MEIMKMVQKKRIEQYLARGHDIRTTSERGGAARSVRHDREPNISRQLSPWFSMDCARGATRVIW